MIGNMITQMAPKNGVDHFPIFFLTAAVALICFHGAPTVSVAAAANHAKLPPWNRKITVDGSGAGDYERVQDAIDAVATNNREPVFIRVEPGVYKEKIVVPLDKPWIILSGRKANMPVITWDDGGDIHTSPTATFFASHFIARYLTFQNTHGAGAKAVAVRVTGDKAAFYGCRILSYQDTLLDETGRHYYENCYIEGAVDFVFGNAASLFVKTQLHSLSQGNWAITAQQRMSAHEDTGFYFVNCMVTGVRSCVLGRPWGSYSRVVFAYTYMSDAVLPEGWNDWNKPQRRSTVYYGEFKNYGPGADRTRRVEWSRNLNTREAWSFVNLEAINGNEWIY